MVRGETINQLFYDHEYDIRVPISIKSSEKHLLQRAQQEGYDERKNAFLSSKQLALKALSVLLLPYFLSVFS